VKRAAVRIRTATLSGEMLLGGQRIPFKAEISYPKIIAEFAAKDENSNPIDQWLALQALETFVDEHMRGAT